MKAAGFYKKEFEGYISACSNGKISLSCYCKTHRIQYRGFLGWAHRNGLSLPKSKHESLTSSTSFVPVAILPPQLPAKVAPCVSTAGFLKGVRISFPEGVNVFIKEIGVTAMQRIIDSINQR